MSNPSRSLLRLPIQIAIWTLMLVALLGPHTHWSICLTGNCDARIETAAAHCSCCHDDAAEDDRDEGDGSNRGYTCADCCVDLAMAIDEGPMPRPVIAPTIEHEELVAVLPVAVPAAGSAVAARLLGHDTGPPRTDRRTDLIATTILRE